MSFVKCSPKYIMLFDAIINGIAFLISFLDHSSQLCRNTTDFLHFLHCLFSLFLERIISVDLSPLTLILSSAGSDQSVNSCRASSISVAVLSLQNSPVVLSCTTSVSSQVFSG